MATVIESRVCPKCKTRYRTKLKKGKGKDTRSCPVCTQEKVAPVPPLPC